MWPRPATLSFLIDYYFFLPFFFFHFIFLFLFCLEADDNEWSLLAWLRDVVDQEPKEMLL